MDQFDWLYEESADRAEDHGDRLPSLSLRRAAPDRACGAHLQGDSVEKPGVVSWTGEKILDWYLGQQKAA